VLTDGDSPLSRPDRLYDERFPLVSHFKSGALTMQSLRMRPQHRKGGIIAGLLQLIGLVVVGVICLGVVGSMLRERPSRAPEPIPAAVGPVAPTASAPVLSIRFGLTEEKRAEIHNCRWQGGMWATAEVERLIPMDQAPHDNHDAWEQFMKERESFYNGREAIAESLVAKKYGLPVETIRAISDEWGEKPMERRIKGIWKVSETPVLFDRDEANRAVAQQSEANRAVAQHTKVPLTPEEKTRDDRQRLIEHRKAKRASRSKKPF
jgi:hypothetical protein